MALHLTSEWEQPGGAPFTITTEPCLQAALQAIVLITTATPPLIHLCSTAMLNVSLPLCRADTLTVIMPEDTRTTVLAPLANGAVVVITPSPSEEFKPPPLACAAGVCRVNACPVTVVASVNVMV